MKPRSVLFDEILYYWDDSAIYMRDEHRALLNNTRAQL